MLLCKDQTVISRDGRSRGRTTGGSRFCQLESCGSRQIGVRWKNGKLTWPCMKGMDFDSDKQTWRIR